MTMEALIENLRYPEDDFEAGLPTMDDLPSEYPEDALLPDVVHPTQSNLLKECLLLVLQARGLVDCLIGTELNIHFDQDNPNWHKRPDWFLALGTSPHFNSLRRKSYLVWQEKVSPYLIMEILSKTTEKEDLGLTSVNQGSPSKWHVYQDILRVPYYVCFDHRKGEIKAFRWEKGSYVHMVTPKSGIWLKELNLGLRIWHGHYQDQTGSWLRFYDSSGKLLPTEAEEKERERAEKERERAEKEHALAGEAQQRAEKEHALAGEAQQRAEKEHALAGEAQQRAEKERLLAMLKAAGIDPDKV